MGNITEASINTATGTIKFENLDALLDDLDKYEHKDLKDALKKEVLKIAQPIVKDIQFFLPSQAQMLSNWGGANTNQQINTGETIRSFTGFPVFHDKSADKGVKAKANNRRGRGRTFYTALLTIYQYDAAAVVYEWAGKKTNSIFAQNLTKKFGAPFRALYKGVDKNIAQVQKLAENAIIETEKEFNRRQAIIRSK